MSKKNIDWNSAQWCKWGKWERTFMFIPKADIHGKTIHFGFAWKRTRLGSVIGEYDEEDNLTPIYSATDAEYARKKDVFIQKLQAAKQ